MSGIVGILGTDGQTPDPALLSQLTHSMAFRGPDTQHSWVGNGIGLGHALLSTSPESGLKPQPLSLDGETWIVADARVDARSDLLSALRGAGQHCSEPVSDAELILRAYCAWGEDCLERLLGDFCFAIWDGRRKSLFCAHDQLGAKPFYYAQTKSWLVFGNTLQTLRMHPEVSSDLNDLAIADFLLFGANQEPATTTFKHIQRLPPAHALSWSGGKISVKRYWTFPADEEIHYKRPQDYEEQFRQLLTTAVKDRVRSGSAAISFSGGLDSTSIAALANRASIALRAITVVYDHVIPDDERHYAGLAAEQIGIPVEFVTADKYVTSSDRCFPNETSPEPNDNLLVGLERDVYRLAASTSRVLISGEGGDAALFPSNSHFRRLLRSGQLGRFVRDGMRYARLRRGLPPMGLRTALKRRFGLFDPWPVEFPDWFNPDFEARLKLRERWESATAKTYTSSHPHRPEAVGALLAVVWQNYLEALDPGVTQVGLEQVHPYIDLRLLRFLFSIPVVPWIIDKHLIRSSMRGILPEQVRLRPKTPLQEDPWLALLRNNRARVAESLANATEYVDGVAHQLYAKSPAALSPNGYQFAIRPEVLSDWINTAWDFQRVRRSRNLSFAFTTEN